MDRKRLYWEDYNKNGKAYNFLETNVTQLKNGREEFERIIAKKLQDQGVNNSRLPVDEIINNLSHNLRRRFSAKIVSYIQKAKQNEKSPEEMKLKIDEAKYYKYSKENIFLNLANIIYTQYEINKKEEKKIDFYDFLSSAVKRINETNGNCKLRSGVGIKEIDWLLIDEFQDFSPLFLALVKAIKKYNSDLKIFCVGDDWQAINSFAGSDVELFNKFEEEFPGNTAIKNLTINWRSNSDIINLGNRIMTDHGVESRPNSENREHGIIECSNINQDTQGQFDISDAKVKFDFNTNADVALLRYLYRTADIIDKHLKYLKDNNEFKVLILSRKLKILQKCDLDDFTKRIEKYFINKYPEDKDKIAAIFNKQIDKNGNEYKQVESKTAHQSKGLEANIVVVLEATNRCFPLIHPDSLLFEIFGVNLDEIIDEERRLFYVACSRAKSDLYLLYEEDLDKKKTLTEFYLNRYA
jgi:DNA helicase-4